MKRYLVFMFPKYEAMGGALDFVGDVDNKESFIELVNDSELKECLNVLDTKTRKIYKTKDIVKDFNNIILDIFDNKNLINV